LGLHPRSIQLPCPILVYQLPGDFVLRLLLDAIHLIGGGDGHFYRCAVCALFHQGHLFDGDVHCVDEASLELIVGLSGLKVLAYKIALPCFPTGAKWALSRRQQAI
jgi:hypothetical protein